SRPPGSATGPRSSPCSPTAPPTPAPACSSSTARPGRSSKIPGTAAPRPTSPAASGEGLAFARHRIRVRAMDPLTDADELAAAFARDGVVCVRAALDPGEVAVAARGIDAVLARPSPLAIVASGADDPGAFTEDFCRWQEIPEIE